MSKSSRPSCSDRKSNCRLQVSNLLWQSQRHRFGFCQHVWGSHFSPDEVEWIPRETVHEQILRHKHPDREKNLMSAGFEPST
jgi:hypothetical protein